MKENNRPYIIAGLITGGIASVLIFIKEPDMPAFEKTGLCIMFTWIFINMWTYRGRYRPKIIYALKICYPLFLYLLVLGATGRL